VGEPASGFLLELFDDRAGDLAGPGIVSRRDLLNHRDGGAGRELFADRFVHGAKGKGEAIKGQVCFVYSRRRLAAALARRLAAALARRSSDAPRERGR